MPISIECFVVTGCLVIIAIFFAARFYSCSKKESKDEFDINVDPLKAIPYDRKATDCGTSYSEGFGGQYGLNPEFNNNITVSNFVEQFEKDAVFEQNRQNLAPTLLYNQTAYDIPARQICEVLYQGHQQYFENMWSGLGECELYQTEMAKKAKNIKVKTV